MNKISPMVLLLKHEGYPSAVVIALLIHGLLLYVLISNNALVADYVDVDKPVYIEASVIDVNPQRLRRLELQEQQRRTDQRAEQRRRDETARVEAQQTRDKETREAAQREETARLERETSERLSREEAALERASEQARIRENERLEQLAREQAARDQETARQAAAQARTAQETSDNQSVLSYMAIIHDTVANYWSIVPSARNNMLVVLELRLAPTGEIITYNIIEASGDAAFDRAALQAVGRAKSFPELQGMPSRLFNQNFRTINLRFRPEDLLR